MADIFTKGTSENNNIVTEIALKDKIIGNCSGWAICQQNGGKCVQDDDMNEIYDEMHKADVIVLECPVYFYTWPSLMKRMIDRTFAIEDYMDKKFFIYWVLQLQGKRQMYKPWLSVSDSIFRASEKMEVKRAVLYLLMIQEKQRMWKQSMIY